jgi:hypothetical protein
MTKIPTFIQLSVWVAKAIGKNAKMFASFSTADLGIALPDAVVKDPAVASLVKNAASSAKELNDIAIELEAAATSGNTAGLIAAFTKFAQKLASHFNVINDLNIKLKAAISPATIPDAAARNEATNFSGSVPKKLLDKVLFSFIAEQNSRLLLLFKILGIAEWNFSPAVAGNALSRDHVIRALHLERLKVLIKDPVQHFKDQIQWGNPGFDPIQFFQIYSESFSEESAIRIGFDGPDAFLRRGNFLIRRAAGNPPGLRMEFKAYVDQGNDVRASFSDSWGVTISPKLTAKGKLTLEITPPLNASLTADAPVAGSFKIFVNRNEAAQPFVIIGGNDILNVAAKDIQMGFGLDAKSSGGNTAAIAPYFFLQVVQGNIKIGTKGSDNFIAKLLGNLDLESNFDLGFEFNMQNGLRVQASGGIEIQLPVYKKIGPIDLKALYIALKILNDGTLSLENSAGFTGSLGPISATVDRIGIQIDARFSDNSNGKFGPLEINGKFKPPTGVGLSVDAGIIKGGGYLDFRDNEYSGFLELSILNIVTARAIGLIATKMPDGSNGFSLLIIITAEFNPAIQLSFGFTLIGVGGLLGLNRTVLLDPLREGVRTGALNSVLFPQNVIENAPRIISDLKTIFPPAPDKFLIGPMIKLGWGTPTLISLSLGIIIEIPGNIAILGVLKITLPEESIAIVRIQVNFLGTIDFGKKMLTFDASLYESYILLFPLEGDMAVRMKWGDDANFLITVGGFHPSYKPPPLGLGTLRRLSVTILSGAVQKIRIECYQAVTSNTVQFGARAEVRFGFEDCNVSGFLSFDALFQFSPFHFIIDISAGLSAEVFGFDLMSITLHFSLEGPGLWRAKGTGSISIPILPDIDVDFDITWGQDQNTIPAGIAILGKFLEEIGKPQQWKAELPSSSNLLVTLRTLPASESKFILHSAGTLVVSQNLLPLNFVVDKIGNQASLDVKEIKITGAQSGVDQFNAVKHEEFFAKAQYKNMSDADKLSMPSYQKMEAGVRLSLSKTTTQAGAMVMRSIRYELKILDKESKLFVFRFRVSSVLLGLFMIGGAAKKSILSKERRIKFQPFAEKPVLSDEGYSVVNLSDNKQFNGQSSFGSEAMARDFLDREISKNPNLKTQVHVVPNYELNTV